MNKKITRVILFLCILGALVFSALFVWKNGRLPFVAQKRADTGGSVVSATCAPSKIDLFGQVPDTDRAKSVASLLDRASRDIFRAHQVYQAHQSEENAQQLRNLAVTRKNLLVETLQRSPDAAFFSLLSQGELNTLSLLTLGCVEMPTIIEGLVEIDHIDLLSGSTQNYYALVTENGERISLFPALGADEDLISGARVRVSGYRIDDMVIFDGSNAENVKTEQDIFGWVNTASAAVADAMGDQKTAVLLVNFQNTAQPSLTKATVQDLLFNQANSYFNEISYGKTGFSGDIFGWYTIPINQTCNYILAQGAAVQAADLDVNFTQYSRLVIIAPFGPTCTFGGRSSLGKISVSTSDGVAQMSVASLLTSNFTLHTAGHELGHGLGVEHANFLNCGTVSSSSSGCMNVEYGNPYSIMGESAKMGHPDAFHKEYIGWFNAPNITTVTNNGTYVLAPIETVSSGLQALKIPRGQNAYLFAEYRQPIGVDAAFSSYTGSDVFQGALVVVQNPFRSQSLLIDTTPPANNKTTTVLVGQTFTDPASGTAIAVTGRTSTALTVNVTLGKTDFDPPAITIISPLQDAVVSGTITMSADAVDASGIEKVEFYKDCTAMGVPFAVDTVTPYQASLDTTQLLDGSNTYIKVVAYDLYSNSRARCWPVTVLNGSDTTPPTISVMAPANGATGNNPVQFQVIASDDRGIQTIEFYKDGESVPLATNITGIASATLSLGAHAFFARARDLTGNTTDSVTISFTVSGGADAVAPTVSMTSPAANAMVSGTAVTLSATAFDNVLVAGVQFKVDGVTIGAESTAEPYSVAYNSAIATNGSHTITATARDAAGNTTTSSGVTVTVNNVATDTTPPTVSLTAPAAGATVSGSTDLSANVTDNVGVQKVDFYRDASVLLGTDTTSPYSFAWNTTAIANGTHTFFARAYDTSGNQASTLSRSVTVNNVVVAPPLPTNPTVVNPPPASSSQIVTVKGIVSVTLVAPATAPVATVEFYQDTQTTPFAVISSAPFVAPWNTTSMANGNHTVHVRIHFTDGKVTNSSITLNMQN